MNTDKNPLSAYDILYHGMSEETREKLRGDISQILEQSAKDAEKVLQSAIEKAVTQMYDSRTANPWVSLLNDCNADAYGFLNTLAEQLWESMLKSEPKSFAKNNSWRFPKLIEAWREKHPEQFAEVCNAELKKEYDKLKELYDFQCEVAQNSRSMF